MFSFDNLVLGSLGIIIIAFMLSRFIHNRMKLIVMTLLVVIGIIMLVNIPQYSTFEEYASKHFNFNEETEINNVTIMKYNLDEESPLLNPSKSITIEDKDVIEKLLQDISELKLKRDKNQTYENREYMIEFNVTNPADGNYVYIKSFSFKLDHQYLNNFKIINSTNPLRTIEEILGTEDKK